MAASASYKYTPDPAGQRSLTRDPSGAYGQRLTRVLNSAANFARQRANVDTGLMRSTIDFRIEEDSEGLVGILSAHTDYAVYVHAKNPFLADGVVDAIGSL